MFLDFQRDYWRRLTLLFRVILSYDAGTELESSLEIVGDIDGSQLIGLTICWSCLVYLEEE